LIARDEASIHTYHLFYTYINPGVPESTGVKLGHARSTDLNTWEDLPYVLHVLPGTWDSTAIWAPSIVQQGNMYYMFYTGVAHNDQAIGVATSTDLYTWTRNPSGPVFSSDSATWTAGPGDFRDPFVMPDPDRQGYWLMYYATRPQNNTGVMAPGLAKTKYENDLTQWEDAGPLFSDSLDFHYRPVVFESPHLFEHDGTWYLVYTGDQTQQLEYVKAADSPSRTDKAGWPFHDWVVDADCFQFPPDAFASEYLADTLAGGTGKELFCYVTGGPIAILPIHWQLGDRFSFDFIRPARVTDLEVGVDGDSVVLRWTAPGNDSLTGWTCPARIAYSTEAITNEDFSSLDTLVTVPRDSAGTAETVTVPPDILSSCRPHYFALKTQDRARNWSALSNVASDTIRPAPVTTLLAGMGKTSGTVIWSAAGEDSAAGTACRYHVAYSTGPIVDGNFFTYDSLELEPPTPVAGGTVVCAQAEMGSLAPCNWYYFAVKTLDHGGNWSAMSNVASGKTKCSGFIEVSCDGGFMAQGEGPDGWSIENSVLDLAGAGTAATDLYRMKVKPGGPGSLARIRLSQLDEGTLSLDAARLAVVDHATGVEAYPCEGHVILGHSSAVYGVSDRTGTELSPVIDASEYARVGTAGSSWDIVLSEKDSPGQALLVEAGGGGLVSDAAKSGIEVQVPTASGGWATVSHLYPRRSFDPLVVDSLPGNQVRLVFDQEYSIRRLARVEPSETVALTPIEPDSALHSRLGHVTEAVAEPSGTSTALQGAHAVVLSYTLPAFTTDTERDVFLLLRGSRPAMAAQSSAKLGTDSESHPTAFALHQNIPNPFAGTTTIRFDLPRAEHVRLGIFDLAGRRVARLANSGFPAGFHAVDWNHSSDWLGAVRPGVYIYRIDAGAFHDQKKLILLP